MPSRYFSDALPVVVRPRYFPDAPCKVCPRAVPDAVTDVEVAAAVVEAYNPLDPETWDAGEDERAELSAAEVAALAWRRYQQALAVLAARGAQKAASGKPRLRCPKGTAKGGRFTTSLGNCGSPSKASQKKAGKTLAAAAKGLHEHLDELKKEGVHGLSMARELRAKLKVKQPVTDRIDAVDGARDAAESTRLKGYAQEVLDMMPPKIADTFPHFRISREKLPDDIGGQWDQHNRTLKISDDLPEYQQRRVVFHEMGHYIHDNGPATFRKAVKDHYIDRTAKNSLSTHGTAPNEWHGRDDQWYDYYIGREYGGARAREGTELVSTQMEHLAGGVHYSERRAATGLDPHSLTLADMMEEGNGYGKAYRETMGVALSIFYYGRT